MPNNKSSGIDLSPAQAQYVLDRLIATRRITAKEVLKVASMREEEIAELERRLAQLRDDSSGARPRGRTRNPSGKPVSAETMRSRKIQGQYMGLLRNLSGQSKAAMKKLAAESGREAAIAAMKRAG